MMCRCERAIPFRIRRKMRLPGISSRELSVGAPARRERDGRLSMSNGRAILAAEVLRADFAYAGSMFIASVEANAVDLYKGDIVANSADSIVYTNLFTGVHSNYLKTSIARAGIDPENLPESDPSKMNFGTSAPA